MSFTLRAPHALFDVVVLLQSQRWLAGEWLECLAEVDLEVERLKQRHRTYGSPY